jgi:hypothetical protein
MGRNLRRVWWVRIWSPGAGAGRREQGAGKRKQEAGSRKQEAGNIGNWDYMYDVRSRYAVAP